MEPVLRLLIGVQQAIERRRHFLSLARSGQYEKTARGR
jgi:hypothetical protein